MLRWDVTLNIKIIKSYAHFSEVFSSSANDGNLRPE